MGAKGAQTREHILATAESIILQRGYSGTSIEEIIGEAGITKGGFFYHFAGKSDLARNLMLRYLENDSKFFGDLSDRARSLTEDPLQQYLLFLKLMAEALADLPGTHPGCLVASFAYEAHQFEEEIRNLNAQGVLCWREQFMGHLERIAEKYPMKIEHSLDELADMLTSVIEGGIIVS
ncbi:MAG: TetR family transcriptional regulator, partial [Haliea sp.]|nr:TetR family transcriptional regulator [Haliea sp.]